MSSSPTKFAHTLQTGNPVVFFDTSLPDKDNRSSLLFVDPVQILQIHSILDLPTLLTTMEDLVQRGYYLAGYFTYECGYFIEKLGLLDYASMHPLAWFGVYRQPIEIASLTFPFTADKCTVHNVRFEPEENRYHTQVERIREHIRAGDVYQVNFTGRYRFQLTGSPLTLYSQLRSTQPTSYSAYLHIGNTHILSLSPELFFRLDSSQITARPMKGTAPRGRTPAEDTQLATWLQQDRKNRAENVMIIDLLRNDLGRICSIGSVTVPHLFDIEQYDTLFQMTSTVTGTLNKDAGIPEIFKSLFPCGSVTGAPKIKAMEIIHQLETSPRGIYTGAIGYITPGSPLTRKAVFNVAIRTLTVTDGHGEMGIGSGIIYDSDPAQEFAECAVKARFLTTVSDASSPFSPDTSSKANTHPYSSSNRHISSPFPDFKLVETVLWNGSYQRLEHHLARMAASARLFNYPFDAAQIQVYLDKENTRMVPESQYKVRLLLDRSGHITCESLLLPALSSEQGVVTISTLRTNSQDLLYYHKTTHRPLYSRATHFAQAHHLADVLFFNERNELTEGAISNIFVERDGLLLTPPVCCGLLNGVFRQSLLDELPHAQEAILSRHDLLTAQQVYICNSVRGLRPVSIGDAPLFK